MRRPATGYGVASVGVRIPYPSTGLRVRKEGGELRLEIGYGNTGLPVEELAYGLESAAAELRRSLLELRERLGA